MTEHSRIALFEVDTEESRDRSSGPQRRTWLVRASDAEHAMSFMPDGAAIRAVSMSRPSAQGTAGIVGWVGDQVPSPEGLRWS